MPNNTVQASCQNIFQNGQAVVSEESLMDAWISFINQQEKNKYRFLPNGHVSEGNQHMET